MKHETIELLRRVFSRPKMYFGEISTVRDLFVFAHGICCGLRPPHGACDLNSFRQFLSHKLKQASKLPEDEGLDSLDGIPFLEIRELVGATYDEWLAASSEQSEC